MIGQRVAQSNWNGDGQMSVASRNSGNNRQNGGGQFSTNRYTSRAGGNGTAFTQGLEPLQEDDGEYGVEFSVVGPNGQPVPSVNTFPAGSRITAINRGTWPHTASTAHQPLREANTVEGFLSGPDSRAGTVVSQNSRVANPSQVGYNTASTVNQPLREANTVEGFLAGPNSRAGTVVSQNSPRPAGSDVYYNTTPTVNLPIRGAGGNNTQGGGTRVGSAASTTAASRTGTVVSTTNGRAPPSELRSQTATTVNQPVRGVGGSAAPTRSANSRANSRAPSGAGTSRTGTAVSNLNQRVAQSQLGSRTASTVNQPVRGVGTGYQAPSIRAPSTAGQSRVSNAATASRTGTVVSANNRQITRSELGSQTASGLNQPVRGVGTASRPPSIRAPSTGIPSRAGTTVSTNNRRIGASELGTTSGTTVNQPVRGGTQAGSRAGSTIAPSIARTMVSNAGRRIPASELGSQAASTVVNQPVRRSGAAAGTLAPSTRAPTVAGTVVSNATRRVAPSELGSQSATTVNQPVRGAQSQMGRNGDRGVRR